jgi:hypothetical protein
MKGRSKRKEKTYFTPTRDNLGTLTPIAYAYRMFVRRDDFSLSFSPSCQPPAVDSCRTIIIPDRFPEGKNLEDNVILSDFPVNTAGAEQKLFTYG